MCVCICLLADGTVLENKRWCFQLKCTDEKKALLTFCSVCYVTVTRFGLSLHLHTPTHCMSSCFAICAACPTLLSSSSHIYRKKLLSISGDTTQNTRNSFECKKLYSDNPGMCDMALVTSSFRRFVFEVLSKEVMSLLKLPCLLGIEWDCLAVL